MTCEIDSKGGARSDEEVSESMLIGSLSGTNGEVVGCVRGGNKEVAG